MINMNTSEDNNIYASSSPPIVSSDADRQEFTKRLISYLHSQLGRTTTMAVSVYITKSLHPNDLPKLILHERVDEQSPSMVTVLESMISLFETGSFIDQQHSHEEWWTAVLDNLALHPYQVDINGIMQAIMRALIRHTPDYDHEISQFGKFLLELTDSLLISHEKNQRLKHNVKANLDSQTLSKLSTTTTTTTTNDDVASLLHSSSTSSSSSSTVVTAATAAAVTAAAAAAATNSYNQFNIHSALHQLISTIPPSAPIHPLWLSFIRLLRVHGASSSVRNGLGKTSLHTLIEHVNIDLLLAWLLNESHNLHSFNLNSRHSPENLSYIRSVYESAARVEEENPYSTPAKLCPEVVTKVIEWQDENRHQYEMKEDEEAKATNGDGESKMDDIELTSATSSFTSPVTSFNIKSWLQQQLVSLPRVLLSSRISADFRSEIERERQSGLERNQQPQTYMPVAASSALSSAPPPPVPPPTSKMKSFITALVSHPNDIHLDECGLIDHCLLAHILMTPHALTHILSVPHAPDLFLWRIDAMSREGMIHYKPNCTSAIYALFWNIVLDESKSQGEQNFIYSLYDAMLAKYVEGVKIDETTGMIDNGTQVYASTYHIPMESSGWIQSMPRWSISAILRVLTLLRKYRIPHDFVRYLLSYTEKDDRDYIREYIRLTMTSDFLEPAFCYGGKNIYNQSQESTDETMSWLRAKNNPRLIRLQSERFYIVERAYQHVITVVYPHLRREIEMWMIPDLASLTMEYLVHKTTQQDFEEEITQPTNEPQAESDEEGNLHYE